jgi:predicted phosphodiesterase
MTKFNSETVLVIGDSHVDDEQSLDRFEALGHMILDRRPDHVVSIGDFVSFHCFSGWDRNIRLKMEGRRREKELNAANEALDLLMAPTEAYNNKRRKSKKGGYNPSLIYIEGNHEEWETRYLAQNPELIGTVDYKKTLKLEERGYIHIPYRDYHYINGVGFTHVPQSKINRPITGARVMKNALDMHAHPVVFGHTHELKIEGQHRHGGIHYQQALNVGCFFEHVDEYAQGSKTDYWRGCILLHMYSPQRFDVEAIAMSRLKEMYGK